MDPGVILHKPIASLIRFLSPEDADSLWSPPPATPAAHTRPPLFHSKPCATSTPPARAMLHWPLGHSGSGSQPPRQVAGWHPTWDNSGPLPPPAPNLDWWKQYHTAEPDQVTLQVSLRSALQKKLVSKYKGKYCHIGVFFNPAPFWGFRSLPPLCARLLLVVHLHKIKGWHVWVWERGWEKKKKKARKRLSFLILLLTNLQ